MSFTYHTDIPDAPNNPSVDQPKMKTNTNAIRNLINVDHVTFNAANGGYHKVIHFIKQASNPAAIASVGQLFTKDYTPPTDPVSSADTQLYFLTGGGGLSQLTGSFTPIAPAAPDGYAWVGGILIQWGFVDQGLGFLNNNSSGTVVFDDRTSCIPFPKRLFSLSFTPFFNGAVAVSTGLGSVQINTNGSSNLQFNWRFFCQNNNTFKGFYWMAIGN